MSAAQNTTRRRPASARATVALFAILATALAGCTVDTSEPVEESPAAPADAEAVAGVSNEARAEQEKVRETCAASPERADTGHRTGADGAVYERDDDGLATIYVLAANDTLQGVANRFCLDLEELYEIYDPNATTLIAGEHIALQKGSLADARRASGYLFPACPADGSGHPIVASINWEPIEYNSPVSRANVTGAPLDTGVAYGAKGTSRSDADGTLIDYTVAANDNWRSIRDRFCFDLYYLTSLIGEWAAEPPVIHPGDVIPLQPQYLEIDTGAPPAE
ncbi:hypothetical protein [Microbacterium oleivorans]|uniref:hypothetical protein n=1 Tax=Microbacterium oleivorans TaxID=273677 RepID=UPI002041545B|nr:hypothetical protein [Microbacterium oleivorans]MCM3695930.1 hypothetical protein [Microbacterium oleivorans]